MNSVAMNHIYMTIGFDGSLNFFHSLMWLACAVQLWMSSFSLTKVVYICPVCVSLPKVWGNVSRPHLRVEAYILTFWLVDITWEKKKLVIVSRHYLALCSTPDYKKMFCLSCLLILDFDALIVSIVERVPCSFVPIYQ